MQHTSKQQSFEEIGLNNNGKQAIEMVQFPLECLDNQKSCCWIFGIGISQNPVERSILSTTSGFPKNSYTDTPNTYNIYIGSTVLKAIEGEKFGFNELKLLSLSIKYSH